MTAQPFDWKARGIQFGFVLLFLLTWHVVGEMRLVNPLLLPTPRSILVKFMGLVQTKALYEHLMVRAFEFVMCFVIAAVGGVGWAISSGARASARRSSSHCWPASLRCPS